MVRCACPAGCLAWLAMLLAACSYAPSYEGSRCGPDGACPPGFTCIGDGEQAFCSAEKLEPPGDGEPDGGDGDQAADDGGITTDGDGDTGDFSPCLIPDADGDGHLALACGGDDCDDENNRVYLGAPEICDGVDNDCDGLTDAADDGLQTVPCQLQQGVCQGARAPAAACRQGHWQPCTEADYLAHAEQYQPVEQACDGLDNDCDGATDEQLSGPLCPLQQGVCTGARRPCLGQAGWAESCSATDYGPDYQQAETRCDGLDNDCDGTSDAADADLVPPWCEQQHGVCQGAAKTPAHCQDGGWRPCSAADYLQHSPEFEAVESKCDGLDNDCDGDIDEECSSCQEGSQTSCPLQLGVCAGATTTCQNGEWLPCDYAAYSNGTYQLPPETTCDGLDNDCDGIVDGMQRPCSESHLGLCAAGSETCVGAGTWEGCPEPASEQCNGFDDDCDGQTDADDPDLVLAPCELDQGVCSGSAVHSPEKCQQGFWQPCDQVEYGSEFSTEVCGDGLDNDCDGITDCGPGVCTGDTRSCQNECLPGQQTCEEGQWGPCLPAPGPEGLAWGNCGDDLDNDCDGASDCADSDCDGASRTCYNVCHPGTQSCQNGAWTTCDAAPLVEERERNGNCRDGVDNDCDGRTDSDENLCCTTAGFAGSLLLLLLWPVSWRRRWARWLAGQNRF